MSLTVLLATSGVVTLSTGMAKADGGSQGLTFVVLPDHEVRITGYLGSETDIVIPEFIGSYEVVEIGDGALRGLGLTSVRLPSSIRVIGGFAFAENELTEVSVPDGVEEVRYSAFEDNLLTKLTFLGDVGAVGNGVTALNQDLVEVVFGGSVGSLGTHAVGGSSLARVHFAAAPPTSIVPVGPHDSPSISGPMMVLTVTYNCAFHASNYSGGFTGPTWKGYSTLPADTPRVSFDMGGFGTQVADQVLACGDVAATAPTEPTSEGMTFTGWFTDAERTAEYDFGTELTDDSTLYAGWEITRYSVSFDSAGGADVEAVTVEHGDLVSEPTAPARDGHTFTGWFVDEDATEAYDFNTEVTADITLYAGWDVHEYTVAFDSAGGDSVDPVTVDHGEVVGEPTATRDGYTFTGWFADADRTEEFDFGTAITGDLALYAGWALNPVTELVLDVEATEVDEGDTITITAAGLDEHGFELRDVTDEITLSSSVETDVIDGNQVTFPTASEHVITATHVDGATAELVITVIPAADEVEPVDEAEGLVAPVQADDEPTTPQPAGGLAMTGVGLAVPAGLAGLVLLVLGASLLVRRKTA